MNWMRDWGIFSLALVGFVVTTNAVASSATEHRVIAGELIEAWLNLHQPDSNIGIEAGTDDRLELDFGDSLTVGRFYRECYSYVDGSLQLQVNLVFEEDTLFGSYITRAEHGGALLGPGLIDLVNDVITNLEVQHDVDSLVVESYILFFEFALPTSHSDVVLRNWSCIPRYVSHQKTAEEAITEFDRDSFLEWVLSVDTSLTDSLLANVGLPSVVVDGRMRFLVAYFWDEVKQRLMVLRGQFIGGRFVWLDSRPAAKYFDDSSWGK